MIVIITGSPRVKSAKLNLKHLDGSVSVLSITTVNNSADNVNVEKLLVNGVEHKDPFISRDILAAKGGVTLEFFMSATPFSGLCPAAAAVVSK